MPQFVMAGNLTIDELLFPDGRHEVRQCGGNALYAAVGARIWTDSVGILSLAGTNFPREWLHKAREHGIDIQGIRDLPRPHGMQAAFKYAADGERTLMNTGTLGGDENERTPQEWEEWLVHSPTPEHIPSAYSDMIGCHLAPIPVQAHERLVKALHKQVRCLTLDSPWWDGAAGRLDPYREMLASLDALLPSKAEVRAFYGPNMAPADAARALGRLGPKAVVMKIGAAGSLVYNPKTDTVTHVPAYPCKVIDPTGAGDSFCGGFLAGLAETGDPVYAACYGTVSASFIVEGFGSLYALGVTRQQAEERLIALTTLIH